MKAKLLKLCLFLAGLVVLQQGIAFGSSRGGQFQEQRRIIESRGIDPGALFYTESALALEAEKTVRRQVGNLRDETE